MARRVSLTPRPALDSAPSDTATRGAVVATPAELGAAVRWLRGAQRLSLEETAAASGLSRNVLVGLEQASRDVHLGHALALLHGVGYDVVLVPRDPSRALGGRP